MQFSPSFHSHHVQLRKSRRTLQCRWAKTPIWIWTLIWFTSTMAVSRAWLVLHFNFPASWDEVTLWATEPHTYTPKETISFLLFQWGGRKEADMAVARNRSLTCLPRQSHPDLRVSRSVKSWHSSTHPPNGTWHRDSTVSAVPKLAEASYPVLRTWARNN